MGYASYLEDIVRRLDEGLFTARERRLSSSTNPSEVKLARDLEILIDTAKRELTRLKSLIDVASDAELDRAQEIVNLRAEGQRLKKAIETIGPSSENLAERYLELVDENTDLQELIQRDLVDEFYDLDERHKRLLEREASLLRQEARLLEKVKSQIAQHDQYVDQQNVRFSNLEAELARERNLREILEVELKKKTVSVESLKQHTSNDRNPEDDSTLRSKVRELEKKWNG